MGFNSGFKGLNKFLTGPCCKTTRRINVFCVETRLQTRESEARISVDTTDIYLLQSIQS